MSADNVETSTQEFNPHKTVCRIRDNCTATPMARRVYRWRNADAAWRHAYLHGGYADSERDARQAAF